jgi:hypothetical protein
MKFHNCTKIIEKLRFALFWYIAQRRVVIAHRSFGTDHETSVEQTSSISWRKPEITI